MCAQVHNAVTGVLTPVVAGAGSNNTIEAIDLASHAEQVGADAVLIVAPYYKIARSARAPAPRSFFGTQSNGPQICIAPAGSGESGGSTAACTRVAARQDGNRVRHASCGAFGLSFMKNFAGDPITTQSLGLVQTRVSVGDQAVHA